MNPILSIDFYKVDHKRQYPEGTNKIYSNFTPRSSRLYKGKMDKIVVFGLQIFIKDYLIKEWNEGFFKKSKEEVVNEYKQFIECTLEIDNFDTSHIEALHNLGYLPIEIKALPEGTLAPMKVPILTITNTHPEFFWLVNYLETAMSTELWKPMTNATIAYEYKKTFEEFADKTGANKEAIIFQGHDFSARGLSNRQDGYKSGIAHLTSFCGTDTIQAIQGAKDFYNANYIKELVGTSVPATEHSVMSMNSKETEIETYKRLITETYPTGIVSIVSDTWNLWKVLTDYTVRLKDEILNRKPNTLGLAKVVFRPDSGNPVDIICGTLNNIEELRGDTLEQATEYATDYLIEDARENTPHGECGDEENEMIFSWNGEYYNAKITNIEWNRYDKQYYFIEMYEKPNTTLAKIEITPEKKGAIEILWDIFGGTINDKGYKVLNERVGLIYGDSITLERQKEILSRLEAKGFDSSNIVLGIGSYTYQYSTRDTFGFAMKATYGEVNGEGREIFKDPVTDSGTKKSAKGLLQVTAKDGQLILKDQCSIEEESEGELKTVFTNGKLVKETSLQEIRELLVKGNS